MTDQMLRVAPALISASPSLGKLPADAPASAGPSFESELARLQHDYRVARGGERGVAYRRLRDALHCELAKELR